MRTHRKSLTDIVQGDAKDFDAAAKIGNGAPLQTKANKARSHKRATGTKEKLLRRIPVEYFEAHEALQAAMRARDFNTFCIEAIKEKLEREKAFALIK